MMGFSSLDWLILLVVLLNVAGAIAQGFCLRVVFVPGRDFGLLDCGMGVSAGCRILSALREFSVGRGYRGIFDSILRRFAVGGRGGQDWPARSGRYWSPLDRSSSWEGCSGS